MKIICKSRLLPPPVPEYEGTLFQVRIPNEDTSIRFREVTRASGSTKITVNWGDGIVESLTGSSNQPTHVYETGGDYNIIVSDDISNFGYIGPAYEESDKYADRLIGFCSKATKIETVLNYCFEGCINLRTLDMNHCSLPQIRTCMFSNCRALSGELFFGNIAKVVGGGTSQPFRGCTGGITKIHFPAASREAIEGGTAFKADRTLGTGTAQVVFDP